jgi:hypothetical protein
MLSLSKMLSMACLVRVVAGASSSSAVEVIYFQPVDRLLWQLDPSAEDKMTLPLTLQHLQVGRWFSGL